MSEPADKFSVSAVRAKRAQYSAPQTRDDQAFVPRDKSPSSFATTDNPADKSSAKKSRKVPFDLWRLASALKDQAQLIGYMAGLAALLAFVFGFLKSNYTARVTLLARESAGALVLASDTEAYRPRQLTQQTLVSLMQSPELLRRVATGAGTSEDSLKGRVQVEQVQGTDLVALTVAGKSKESLVDLANRFANGAVEMGRELQVAESAQMNQFCTEKLVALDKQLSQLNNELVQFQKTEKLADPDAEKQGYVRQLGDVMARTDNARIEIELVELQIATLQNELLQENPIAQKLEAARSKLTEMYGRYTEAHPLVLSQRKLIAELEKQLPSAGNGSITSARYSENPQVTAMYSRLVELRTRKMTLQREMSELTKLNDSLQGKVTGLSEKGLRYATIKAQLDGLQKTRAQLAARQREAQLYQENSQGYYRVFTSATLKDVDSTARWFTAFLCGIAGLLAGGLGMGLVVVGQELADRRLKTADDVRRETGLPVLASVGDLNQMSQTEKEAWAFRTWTAISGQLNSSPNHGMVCGFISSSTGEGRSTWIELLVGAAKQRGLQVMTVSTRPGNESTLKSDLPPNVVPQDFSGPLARGSARKRAEPSNQTELSFSQAVQVATRPAPEAHIPLPGKVWDLAHRKEWQNSLAHLRRMDNLVLLVELPPASMPEAVLLAESLPQLIWLADSGKAGVRDTRQQLQTLRHAKCRLVGAVLNHEPKPVFDL